MKKLLTILLSLLLLGAGTGLWAQNVGINSDGSAPDASAGLDVKFTDKGFLPPRMTHAQRNAILNPAAGLMLWCTDCATSGELQVYNGTAWTNMIGAATALGIGDPYKGGKLAYILQPGDPGYVVGEFHGLIAAINDQSTGADWGCMWSSISGADGTAIGTGNQNTIDILAGCTYPDIAADLCNDYTVTDGGITYSDWYLPSIGELNMLYINKNAIGGFDGNGYWSSSEMTGYGSDQQAWCVYFFHGGNSAPAKWMSLYVRAVRSF